MNDLIRAIDPAVRLTTNPNMVLRIEDDDCAILFDPDAGRVRVLNVTAAAVWGLVDGQRSVAEILAELRATYDGFDAAAEAQVLALLAELQGLGALAHAAASAP